MDAMVTVSMVLLGMSVLILFLLLLAVVRAGGCLQRVERLLLERDPGPPAATTAAAERPANDSAFREFLSEDPARRKLPKREQFDAYRRWRREKGLNWGES